MCVPIFPNRAIGTADVYNRWDRHHGIVIGLMAESEIHKKKTKEIVSTVQTTRFLIIRS